MLDEGDIRRGGRETAGAAPYTSVQRAALDLLECADTATLVDLALDACLAELNATAGAVYLLQDDGWLLLGTQRGFQDDLLVEHFRTFPLNSALPAAESVRLLQPVFTTAEKHRDDFPDVPRLQKPLGYACFPLVVDGRALGTVLLETSPRPPTCAEHVDATMITTVCANRLEHLLSLGRGLTSDGSGRLNTSLRLLDSRSRKTRLELALSSGDMGVYDWDFDSGRVLWDERLCQLFGVRPEDFDERIETFYRFVHPDDRQRVKTEMTRGLESGRYGASYRVVRPTGEVRWVRAEGRVFHNPAGRPQGIVGIVRDRTEAHRRKARDSARREFMLNVTQGMMGALSVQEVIDIAATSVLPALGARDLVLFVWNGEYFDVAGSHGFTEAEVEQLRVNGRTVMEDPGLAGDLMRGPAFLESPAACRELFSTHVDIVAGRQSWAVLPLSAPGTSGLCDIGFAEPHTFTEDDRALCLSTAGVLAQALDRAQLLDQRRNQMTELQRMMLPSTVPDFPGFDLAARYLPGSEGLDVGGDWYDVIPAPDGRVMLTIGDVEGHSADAAAVMGHLRVAMRAHASEGIGPAELLRRGNQVLCDLDTERFATCTAVEVSPSRNTVRVARAGHALPLLLGPDGRPYEMAVPGGIPLGCFAHGEYPASDYELPSGSLLMLYTDGLVERRSEDYDTSVNALSLRLAGLAPHDAAPTPPEGLGSLADRIIAPAGSQQARDDIAVLLLRRQPAATVELPSVAGRDGADVARMRDNELS